MLETPCKNDSVTFYIHQQVSFIAKLQKQTTEVNQAGVCVCLCVYVFFSHLHRFPSQDEEVLGSHHHEAHELVAQDLLDLVRLGGTIKS